MSNHHEALIPGQSSVLLDSDVTIGAGGDENIEISIVLPCLNEADTLATCLDKAAGALRSAGIAGEIIVADNGSTDGSREIAVRHGARVVPVAQRGYGSALMGGMAAARGRYVLMGDADDSYDFREIPRFVEKLREGYDLVQGCRLPSGGGQVLPGAMPPLHRWLGNPAFSVAARLWFGTRINDIHCGMRAFTRQFYQGLDLQCTGMEFASEMIIKAALWNARVAEIPITLHPDGRTSHPPHLRTFRDGWRHLRFFLLFSPRWLFMIPGVLLITLGALGYAIAMPRMTIAGIVFDVHTLLFASLAVILGYQAILFAVFTKIFAISERLVPADARMTALFGIIDLEKGLVAGVITAGVGLVLLATAALSWRAAGFGPLDYASTMRWVIPGVTLAVLGFQTIWSSFFLSVLGLKRR